MLSGGEEVAEVSACSVTDVRVLRRLQLPGEWQPLMLWEPAAQALTLQVCKHRAHQGSQLSPAQAACHAQVGTAYFQVHRRPQPEFRPAVILLRLQASPGRAGELAIASWRRRCLVQDRGGWQQPPADILRSHPPDASHSSG